ncbi:hypothetical protein [Kurthia massiliensis]|uniref:hypothetical protein n=1 Tax=Kurthia massiliensis TaxID=1033739 RepID=UPI0012B59746|nr:hypothetical protein [Kurthia massiliensis]
MIQMINSELLKRINELKEPNRTFLLKLLEDVEEVKQKDEVRNALRSNIREYVAKEMKS